MPVTIGELLAPQVIIDTISEVNTNKGELAKFMGFALGSGGIRKVPTRVAEYRIFNHTREPAAPRIPGTGPQAVPPNPVGTRRVAMARMFEKIVLDAEMLGNISRIDGPNSQLDVGGQNYIKSQMDFLGEKFNAAIQFMTAGALRGIFYMNPSGDNWTFSFSSTTGSISVDLAIPSGNKTQLDMLGSGSIIDTSWDNPAAQIVTHCIKIGAAMVQLTGMPLQNVVLNSVLWEKVINNTQVRSIGGTVQAPFDSFNYVIDKVDGYKNRGMGKAVLKALPWLTWNICDEVLSVGGSDPVYSTGTGTLTKVVPNENAVFMPDPDNSWCQMWHGGELVAEDYGKPMVMRTGLYAWKRFDIEPTTVNILSLLNAVPVYYRPQGVCYGTVVFS